MRGHILAQSFAQAKLAAGNVDELDLGAGQVDRRGADEDAVDVRAGLNDVLELRSPDDHVVRRGGANGMGDAQRARGVTLRIGVDDKHGQAAQREARGNVDRRGCLTDAALLVRDGDNARGRGLAELGPLKHGQVAQVSFDLSGQWGVVGTHVTPS